MRENPQPPWASCTSALSPAELWSAPGVQREPLVLSLGILERSWLFAPSLQILIRIGKIPPELPLLQSEQSQLSACPHHSNVPVLQLSSWPFTGLFPVCPCLSWCPELEAVFQIWSYHCWVDIKDPFPWPVGNTILNVAQETAVVLTCKGTLPAQVQPVVSQDPQIFFCRAASQLGAPAHPSAWSYTSPDAGEIYVELHEFLVTPFLHPCPGSSLRQQNHLVYRLLLPVSCHL